MRLSTVMNNTVNYSSKRVRIRFLGVFAGDDPRIDIIQRHGDRESRLQKKESRVVGQ